MYSAVHVHVQCINGISVLCNWCTVQYMYMYNVLMELVYCVIDVQYSTCTCTMYLWN